MKNRLKAFLKTTVLDLEDGSYIVRVDHPQKWMSNPTLAANHEKHRTLEGKLKVLSSAGYISLAPSPLGNLSIDYRQLTIRDMDGLLDHMGKTKSFAQNVKQKQKCWQELPRDNTTSFDR